MRIRIEQARHQPCFAGVGGDEMMAISRELLGVDLTFHCPGCEVAVIRKGSWIKSSKVFVAISAIRKRA
ncbi:hypothetical protein [Mesorhizobium sp. B1-1-8]|uniref:hypothetical protein n=1 Tax=Mesorhizobium sp. B1-1-8 TaxID=2589976 RepID=UPI00112A5441|nr:hypothetical protein [Mesorhizobium sp. B1-1-8]UCI05169.1 hypothetical protein FJ974_14975 [Mesorhizobium sp. B1-1-8]